MRHWLFDRMAVSLVAAAIASCAGNGDGLDANGRPVASGGDAGSPLTADFDSIQTHVLTPVCTACHAGGGAPQGLRLDAASSYDLLVGVPSQEQPSLLRVKPGDPDGSYLVQKIEGRAAVGARMPLGGPYLDQATIDVIRQWISDGALRSPAAAAGTSFVIAATSPARGDVLSQSPARVIVAFTEELDRTRLDEFTIRLESVAIADGQPAVRTIAASVDVPDANPRALLVAPRRSLANGSYRLVAERAALVDLAGRTPGLVTSDGPQLLLTAFEVRNSP